MVTSLSEPLPPTDLLKQERLLFVLSDGIYYHAGNSGPITADYIELCNIRLPLNRWGTLGEEENIYRRRNQGRFQELKQNIRKTIAGKTIDFEIDSKVKEDVYFFLKYICKPYQQGGSGTEKNSFRANESYQSPAPDKAKGIYESLLPRHCAVINRRIYPLREDKKNVFVSLRSRDYRLSTSIATVCQMEAKFQDFLESQIVSEVISENAGESHRIEHLERTGKDIASLEVTLGIQKHAYCYEFGVLGYDTSIRSVYCLISPHYNKTSGESYGEGQIAATLPISALCDDSVSAAARIATRTSREDPFYFREEAHCFGSVKVAAVMEDITLPNGKKSQRPTFPLESKMYYLQNVAVTVHSNGAFHA